MSMPSMSCAAPRACRPMSGLPEQEAFNIEYWLLEEAKLQRMPKPKSLAGPGCASSPAAPAASARRSPHGFSAKAPASSSPISTRPRSTRRSAASPSAFGKDNVRGVMHGCHPARTRSSTASTMRVLAFGGLDIVVNNAGISSAAPVEDTTPRSVEQEHVDPRHRLFPGGARGYRLMKRQGSAARWCSSARRTPSPPRPALRPIARPRRRKFILRAAWRSKGRRIGIRVNVVNPDAVLRGSKIWQGEWRQQRAASNKISGRGTRGALPQALAAAALGLSRGHRRGRLFLRLRPVGQIDRQFPQCRCRQCRNLHEVDR